MCFTCAIIIFFSIGQNKIKRVRMKSTRAIGRVKNCKKLSFVKIKPCRRLSSIMGLRTNPITTGANGKLL